MKSSYIMVRGKRIGTNYFQPKEDDQVLMSNLIADIVNYCEKHGLNWEEALRHGKRMADAGFTIKWERE